MGNFLDSIIPFFVGHRTEIIGLATTILKILAATGVIPHQVGDIAGEVGIPLGLATLGAKVSRQARPGVL